MIVTDVRVLGAVVRQRRLALGWSQDRLATAAGVSRPWVSEFETGKTSVEIGLVFAVLDALDLHVNVTSASVLQTSRATEGAVAYRPARRSAPTSKSRVASKTKVNSRSMAAGEAAAAGKAASNETLAGSAGVGARKMTRPAITKGGKSIAAARARSPFGFETTPSGLGKKVNSGLGKKGKSE